MYSLHPVGSLSLRVFWWWSVIITFFSHRWSRSHLKTAPSVPGGQGCPAGSSCCASGWCRGRSSRSTDTRSRRRAVTGDGPSSAAAEASPSATSPRSVSLYSDTTAAAADYNSSASSVHRPRDETLPESAASSQLISCRGRRKDKCRSAEVLEME